MTPEEYRAALSTLGLSQLAAGRWLNVSPKTAQNYASKGPSGPAAVAIRMRLALSQVKPVATWEAAQIGNLNPSEDWVRASELSAVVGVDPPA